MSQKVRDVLDVLNQARSRFNAADGSTQVRDIRQAAIKFVANQRDVTPETIRDACVRRLSPDIAGVADFDMVLGEWLSGRSLRIRQILHRHHVDRGDELLIDAHFFAR